MFIGLRIIFGKKRIKRVIEELKDKSISKDHNRKSKKVKEKKKEIKKRGFWQGLFKLFKKKEIEKERGEIKKIKTEINGIEKRKVKVKKPKLKTEQREIKKIKKKPWFSWLRRNKNEKAEKLLLQGGRYLNSKDVKNAENIYKKIRGMYNSEYDKDKELYKRILRFYEGIVEERKNKG